jgi:two-component system, cell cycle sensor histidine kinase and response regulator CckA
LLIQGEEPKTVVVHKPVGNRQVLLSPILWLLGLALAISFYMIAAHFMEEQSILVPKLYLLLSMAMILGGILWFSLRQFQTLDKNLTESMIYKEAFDQGFDPQIILDRDGRSFAVNQAANRIVPRKHEPLLAALDKMLLQNDKEGRFQLSVMRSAAADGQSSEIPFRTYAGGNYNARMMVAAVALTNFRGMSVWRVLQNVYRSGTHDDLSPEIKPLLNVLDQLPIGMFTLGQDGVILGINQTLAGWLGYQPGEIIQNKLKIDEFIVTLGEAEGGRGDDEDTNLPSIQSITLRDKKSVPFQASLVKVRLQNITTDIPDENPIKGGGLILRQIDGNPALEAALRKAQLLFKRFFEDAPVGIVLIDVNGRITESNRSFRKMMEKTLGKVEGRMAVDAIKKEDRERLAATLSQAMATQDPIAPFETKVLTAQEKVASLYIGRLEDDFGSVIGFIIHFVDVTEQKNLEVQFVQSQKMQAVGQLAGGIAHDFNNILTAIIGYCDLLLLRHRPGDQSFGDIQQIKQNSTRAANLTRQLLAFSRQQQLKPRVLSITDNLSELTNLLRRLIGENIKLDMLHGRDLWPIKADQVQFEQVIINMAVNARDAMPKGGSLTIKTQNIGFDSPANFGAEVIPAGEYVLLEVRDTGIGIPKENLTRIFEPFFTTKGPGSGTGLGLSTVYGIVKQTGGFIVVDSQVGQGTSFGVYLPRHAGGEEELANNKAEQENEDNNVADLTGAGTILLVEDEDAVRSFSSRALRNKGYKVIEAASGDIALKMLLEEKIRMDLLVTDVMMPGIDGAQLIREVKKIMPDMKVICISGYAEETMREKIGSDQAVHFLPKPFSLKQLAGKVKELMGQ